MKPGWAEVAPGLLAYEADDRRNVCEGRPAVFCDRDGVLNELVPDRFSGTPESPLEVSDVRLIRGAAASMRELSRAGFVLVCATNQPAAAKGSTTVERLQAVHEQVVGLLSHPGVRLDASWLCLHHPDGVVPSLSGACRCRKPQPGMLLNAAAALGLDLWSSWMIGDTHADVTAGQSARCGTILIEYPGSSHKRLDSARPGMLAADLAAATALLVGVSPAGTSSL